MEDIKTIEVEVPLAWEYYLMTCDGDRYSEKEWRRIENFLRKKDIVLGLKVLDRSKISSTILCQCA